jgi:hypothetical protein
MGIAGCLANQTSGDALTVLNHGHHLLLLWQAYLGFFGEACHENNSIVKA